MKKAILIISSIALLILSSSCGQDLKDEINNVKTEYEAIKSEIQIDKSSLSISSEEQTLRIQVNCNSYWKAETQSDWFYLQNNNMKGNGTLTVNVNSNPSTKENRKGSISVTDGIKTIIVSITQDPATEILKLSENTINAMYYDNFYYINIESNVDWTATTNANWITLNPSYPHLVIYVSDNISYTPRTANIVVKGSTASATITVAQAALQEPTIYDASMSSITKNSALGQFSFQSSDIDIQICGICYSSTSKEPTTNNEHVYQNNTYYSTVSFLLSGLSENTTYYARPYIITSIGTTYGNTIQFTTLMTKSPGEEDNPTPGYE